MSFDMQATRPARSSSGENMLPRRQPSTRQPLRRQPGQPPACQPTSTNLLNRQWGPRDRGDWCRVMIHHFRNPARKGSDKLLRYSPGGNGTIPPMYGTKIGHGVRVVRWEGLTVGGSSRQPWRGHATARPLLLHLPRLELRNRETPYSNTPTDQREGYIAYSAMCPAQRRKLEMQAAAGRTYDGTVRLAG